VVGDHERGTVSAQQLVDGFGEPALVAELEAVAPGRQQGQRAAEPVEVALEVRGELPDDRAELFGLDERLDGLVVAPDALSQVLEALDVREVSAGLRGEYEVGRRLLDPARHGVR
jgi:hypothetical protein